MASTRLLILFAYCCAAFPQANDYNPIYRGEAGAVFSRKPNAFLVAMLKDRKPGAALDVGMGQGRNAIYLVQQGWDVMGIDASDEGVAQARKDAARLGLRIRAQVVDFEQFDFGQNRWDLIVLTYEPTKAIAPKVVGALKPGGAVLVEDRHIDTRRVWPAGSLSDNELPTLFPGLRILHYEDVWARPDWSARNLDERIVRLFAEKPAPRPVGCLWESKLIPEGGDACWDTAVLRCAAGGWQFTREKCR